MIRVSQLTYEYPGKRALDNVSFTVESGSITALVGPNGSGKTTLLRCLAALDEPLTGQISIAGIDVQEHPREAHKQLGYLSDSFGLYGDLTVRQCLLFSGRLHAIPESALAEAVARVVTMLELTPYLGQKASSLSRGWRQRLGIAQAIIHQPRLLLLDEPASGLDPEARASLSILFRQLQSEGMTMLVSSHILAELEDYCTDMLVLRDGRMTEHRSASVSQTDSVAVHITTLGMQDMLIAALRGHSAVEDILPDAGGGVRVHIKGGEAQRYALLKELIQKEITVTGFSVHQVRLQDIYLSLPTHEKVS